MKSITVLLGFIVVTGLLSGCAAKPRNDELLLDYHRLYGVSDEKLLSCMGVPARQTTLRGSEYLTYARKRMGGRTTATGVIPYSFQCDVTFVIRKGRVIKASAFGNDERTCAQLTARCFP